MFKKVKKIATLATLCTLVMTGCSGKTEKNETQKNDDILVTLVLDRGGVNDGSFNESAWNGATMASQKLGVEVKYLESHTETDYIQNIEIAVDMDSDIIIGVGFNLSAPIEEASKSYPEQKFAIVDGSFEEIPSNVTPILFDENGAGYLAGLATAKTMGENVTKFGFVGGFEIPAVINYKNGFEKGLLEVNPNATLYTQYANSFTDASKGRAMAQQMLTNGIECIMTAAGGVNNGVYEACSEKNKYAVGVDMAQNYIAPKTILTSAIKKVDVGVYNTIENLVNGSLQVGSALIYNMENDGIGFEQTDLLSTEAIEYVNSKK